MVNLKNAANQRKLNHLNKTRNTNIVNEVKHISKALLSIPSIPSSNDMETVYALWDELEQFPAGNTEDALKHLALTMKSLLKADNVKWLGAARVIRGAKARKDSLLGWRLRASYDLVPETEEYRKFIAWWFRQDNHLKEDFLIGLATHALIAGSGKFQVHRMRDGWIPFREFSQSEHYKLHYTQLGITDRIWVSFPLNTDTESVFLIDRVGASRHFSNRDAAIAAIILRGIKGFHRRLFLSRGLIIGEAPLSPVSQRIVQKLLTGMSEKEIALAMNQSQATTHKYIKTIYERFGVNGRAALMSLWLGA